MNYNYIKSYFKDVDNAVFFVSNYLNSVKWNIYTPAFPGANYDVVWFNGGDGCMFQVYSWEECYFVTLYKPTWADPLDSSDPLSFRIDKYPENTNSHSLYYSWKEIIGKGE